MKSSLCALSLFVAMFASGQAIVPQSSNQPVMTLTPEPNTFGTSSETLLIVSSDAFTPQTPGVTWGTTVFAKYTSGGGCCLNAGVVLPEGALVTAIGIEGCDKTTAGSLQPYLSYCAHPANGATGLPPCPVAATGTTGTAETPQCGVFRTNVTPYTVNNAANTYFVEVYNPAPQADLDAGLLYFRSVLIYYKLQVSPSPAVATFTDVPLASPLNKFVEALFAAGITAGCGNGNYCPNDPVTRGQMAVFLASALGLHWAP